MKQTENWDKLLKVADITHFEWTEDIPGTKFRLGLRYNALLYSSLAKFRYDTLRYNALGYATLSYATLHQAL